MIDRGLRSPAWFLSSGVAVVYLASLSTVFVQETEKPSPMVLAAFRRPWLSASRFDVSGPEPV